MPEQDSDQGGGGDRIEVGDVSGTGIAIGRSASANVSSGLTPPDIAALFATLDEAVGRAVPERREEAERTVVALKTEVAKAEKADDSRVARLIDRLVDLVPGAVSAVVSTFATPILGGIAGPVTKFVLDGLK